MKIVMLTPHAPYPPNSGGRIRQWEQIKYLGRRHDLTVVSFVDTEEEYEQRNILEDHCKNVVIVKRVMRALPEDLSSWRKLPWQMRGYASLEMRHVLEQLDACSFDLALIENIFMAQYRDIFAAPTVLQEYNIESQVLRQYVEHPEVSAESINGQVRNRAFWNATWRLFAEYEDAVWPTFPLRTVVSEQDKKEIDRRCPAGRTVVIENGVNLESRCDAFSDTSRRILFMGTMNYPPNADAVSFLVESILPLVWQKDSSIVACIAGRNMPQSIKDLASDPRIEVYDSPEDMCAIARECCVSIVPLRVGGGTRIKILDAFSMGLPVVSTSLGCEGLSAANGHHLLTGDEPVQFADAVMHLLSDSALRGALRSNAGQLVKERYQWQSIFQKLETEMLSLVDSSTVMT